MKGVDNPVWNTHNTKDCHKWNADGSPQGKKEYRGKGTFANTAGRDDDFKQAFAQTQKELKIMKKMILKQGKKNKRLKKRRYLKDSSDNDSSDKMNRSLGAANLVFRLRTLGNIVN